MRILSATNRDLRGWSRPDEFREDLFYRLNVVRYRCAAAARAQDRHALLSALPRTSPPRRRRSRAARFRAEAVAALAAYPWPGNVRELQNVIERACALTEGPSLSIRDFPEKIRSPQSMTQPDQAEAAAVNGAELSFRQAKAKWIEELEDKYLRDILSRFRGNVSQAARAAQMDRTTFHRLLNKHRIR